MNVDAQANTETQVRTPVFGTTLSFVTKNTNIVMSTGRITDPKPATFAAKAVMKMKADHEEAEIMHYQYLIVSSVLNFVRL